MIQQRPCLFGHWSLRKTALNSRTAHIHSRRILVTTPQTPRGGRGQGESRSQSHETEVCPPRWLVCAHGVVDVSGRERAQSANYGVEEVHESPDTAHGIVPNGPSKPVRIVSPVRYHILAPLSVYESFCLTDVMSVPCGQYVSQWIAQAIHTHVNLCTESAPASAERLRLLAPFSEPLPPHMDEFGRSCIRSHTPSSHHRANRL